MVKESGRISRFLHLLSAFGVEAALGPIFYLWLAWHDASLYGDIMYAIMAGSVVSIAVQFGLYAPLVRELTDQTSSTKEILLRYGALRFLIMFITLAVTVFAVYYIGLPAHLAHMTIIVAIGFGFRRMAFTFFADLRVHGQQRIESRIVMRAVVCSFAYAFLSLALGFGPRALSAYLLIWGFVLSYFAYKAVEKKYGSLLSTSVKRELLRPTLSTGTLFAAVALLRLGFHHTTIFFLERSSGSSAVGYYCASLGVVDVTIMIISSLYLEAVFFPEVNKIWPQDQNQTFALFRRNALWLLAITMPITYFLFIESKTMIGIIYPASYASSVYVLQCMAFTIPLFCLASVFYHFLIVTKQEKTLLALSLCAFVVNIFLNGRFVLSHGIIGAALVPVFTGLFRVLQYLIVCQARHKLFSFFDLLVPLGCSVFIVAAHKTMSQLLPLHLDLIVALGIYVTLLVIYRLLTHGPLAWQKAQ